MHWFIEYSNFIQRYNMLLFIIIIGVPLCYFIYEYVKKFRRYRVKTFDREMKDLHREEKARKPLETTKPDKSTHIGSTSFRKQIYVADNARHVFVAGTTGSGKTVALANFIENSFMKNYPCVIIDGKGDTGEGSILEIVNIFAEKHKRNVHVISLTSPSSSNKYNPFRGANPTICKDMLINLTIWSEEHYKLNTERFIQRLAKLLELANIDLSFNGILPYLSIEKYNELSAMLLKSGVITKTEHAENINISKTSGKIAEDAVARFAGIAESEIGSIFSDDGVDVYTAISRGDIIVFILNPLIYPEVSPLFGRLILIDCKKAVSNLFNTGNNRIFFIFDEINSYVSSVLVDLLNKSRSANVTCVVATQSLADLEIASGDAFKQQIIENCNNYIVLRQNTPQSSEEWAKVIGTKRTVSMTYKIEEQHINSTGTGKGSLRPVREFIFHPDDIKQLKQGTAFFVSKDTGEYSKITVRKPF